MQNFEFLHPYFFILLLLIVCIYRCPKSIKEIVFPHTHLFNKKTSFINIEKIIYSLIVASLVTALATPIIYSQKASSKRKGRDLVFVLDTSGSMNESGFDKENPDKKKFDILKELLREFISKRYDDNVGVSIFGTYAFGAIPLTYDMKSVAFLLDFFDVGIAGESTAIGEGIDRGVKILKSSQAKSKVMILITDGYQNSGRVSIKEATSNAKKMGIKIYTIGIGKRDDFDDKLLKLIAKESNAKMFMAQNAKMLKAIYQELDKLEPSKIRSQHYLNIQQLYIYPLFIAISLMLYLIIRSKEEKL